MVKLLKFLRPYRLYVALIFVLLFFQSLSQLYLPTLMSDIVDTGIVKGDTGYIWRIGGLMLLVSLGGAICTIFVSYYSAKVAGGAARNLRSSIFARVESYSLHEFDHFGTASLITRTTNDITQLQQFLTMALRMLLSAPMICIGGIIMAISKDGKLSLIVGVIIPVMAILVTIVAGKAVPLFKTMQKKLDKVNLVLREGLIGIRVIRAFNRVEHEKARFNEANRDLTDTAVKVNKLMAAIMPIMTIFMNFTIIAVIWFGGIRIDNGSMQVGDLMAFIQYIMQIMFSLIMVSMMFFMIPRASASIERINQVFEINPEIVDAAEVNQANGQRGYVEFRDVTFRYPGAEEPVLSNISFSARPGEVTAIIGGTGSGKSTLINLIPRFYDVEKGSVLVDGVDIREIAQEDLRARVGFVPQQAVLFTGTVSENIRFGKQDAADEEVARATEIAQATEFILEMQDGFDSTISQGGTNVSGGQKQRLSIARALVRKPEIYIFDDSFSALDFKTDAKLRAALKQETLDSTVLIVAQRVSTVMDANQIIVLDAGEIVGVGTHKELLKSCEVYREIVASQLSEEEIA